MSATADALKPAWTKREKTILGVSAACFIVLLAALSLPRLAHSPTESFYQRDMTTLGSVSVRREAQQVMSPASRAAKSMTLHQTPAAGAPALADRKVIQTSFMELLVTSPAETAEKIRTLAESLGGYLEASQIAGSREAPSASLTIRVPASGLNQARADLRKLAVRIESERSDATDVTKQYVDMEARLRNLHAQETQYLVILKQATSVEDLLNVSARLSEVRGQIEQEQTEFNALSHQVETVAISVTLRAEADAQVLGLHWRPLYRVKIAARDGFDSLANYGAAMAAVLFQIPAVLAWLGTVLGGTLVIWRLFRWTARKFFGWTGSGALAEKAAN